MPNKQFGPRGGYAPLSDAPPGFHAYVVCRESDAKKAWQKLGDQERGMRLAVIAQQGKIKAVHKTVKQGWTDEWFEWLGRRRDEAKLDPKGCLVFESWSRGRRPKHYDPARDAKKQVDAKIYRKFEKSTSGVMTYFGEFDDDLSSERSAQIKRGLLAKKMKKSGWSKERKLQFKPLAEKYKKEGKTVRGIADLINQKHGCDPVVNYATIARWTKGKYKDN